MRLLPLPVFILLTIFGSGACARERKDPMHQAQHVSIYIARPPAERFAADRAAVETDLRTLKDLLEQERR